MMMNLNVFEALELRLYLVLQTSHGALIIIQFKHNYHMNFLCKERKCQNIKNMNFATNPGRALSSLGNSLEKISLPVYVIYAQLF